MTRSTADAWRQHEDLFTTPDGIQIGYSDTGNTDADTTILFLHGWTQNREAWDEVADPLREKYPALRVVAIDHRGHGKSDSAPKGTVNLTQLADDVAAFIATKIPNGRLIVVGHSMGGMTMMRLGMTYPDLVYKRVAGAVFVATSPGKLLKPLRIVRPLFAIIKTIILGVMGQGWVLQQGYLMRPIVSTLVFGRNPHPYDVNHVWEEICSGDPRAYKEAANSLLNNDLYSGLPPYRSKPVAVLAGGRDFLTPAADSRDIAAGLQTNELRIYPGSGHMLPNERTTEVIDEISCVVDSLGTAQLGAEATG